MKATETTEIPPILLLAWKRPDTTKQVINNLRGLKPSMIFIACDGPIHGDSENHKRVKATRDLLKSSIDWPCQVEWLLRSRNEGSKYGVAQAIDWFFSNVDHGIILEDDCVPHPDFFHHCAALLDRYKNDTRVWCISGNNFQKGAWRGDGSYYFGKIPLTWGWATWKRCWQQYDVEMTEWPKLRDSDLFNSLFDDDIEQAYWKGIWDYTHSTRNATAWDYQWTFTCIANGGLTAIPNVNLVSNIGFGPDATHTRSAQEPLATSGFREYKHPSFILRDRDADRYVFDYHFGGASLRAQQSRTQRIRSMAKRSLKKVVMIMRFRHDTAT